MYENIGTQNDGLCFVFTARVVNNLKNSRKHHIPNIFTEVPLVK